MIWSSEALSILKPRPRLTVSEWADLHRVIAPGTSPEPGPWRTSRVPYLREPMDAISDPAVERVVVMAGSQVAKSELLLNAIGYYADADPAPILLVQPTEIAMQGFSKERIAPTFRSSPALRGKLGEALRDPDNTIMLRQFPGGMLACAWATSAVSLASRPIRVLLLDEVDRYPPTTGRDGDPISQAIQRTANFHNRKIVMVSTPTIEGTSPIADAYEDSDRRRYWMPCPRCGCFQVLAWGGVIYKSSAGEIDLSDVHYRCAHCEGRIEERDRPEMLRLGEWRAENPGHQHRGYHVSGLCSPWVRWADLAALWVKVHADRDRRGLQEFVNLKLGEPYTSRGDEVTAEALEANRRVYDAELPAGVLLLTAGVDTQDNRLEVEVVGWGLGKESWGIAYRVFVGDTSDLVSPRSPWRALDAFLAQGFTRAGGESIGIWCACIDSGGHRTDEVYEFCRSRISRNIFAVKGYSGAGKLIAGKPTATNKLRIPLFPVGVDTAKETVQSRLSLRSEGPGYCHFPRDPVSGYDAAYFLGLTAERRVRKIRAGRPVFVWEQIRERNEPLDCRVYATAALEIVNPDLQAFADALAAPRPAAPAAPPPRRRVYSQGVSV